MANMGSDQRRKERQSLLYSTERGTGTQLSSSPFNRFSRSSFSGRYKERSTASLGFRSSLESNFHSQKESPTIEIMLRRSTDAAHRYIRIKRTLSKNLRFQKLCN